MTVDPAILASLPTEQRLALAYASQRWKTPNAVILGLDSQLAQVVRRASQPIIGQIRLAWWREQIEQAGLTASGDPVQAQLKFWPGDRRTLIAMVDGWEAMLTDSPMGDGAFVALGEGRAAAFAELARSCGASNRIGKAERAAHGWTFADLASRLSDPAEKAAAVAFGAGHEWPRLALPRALRPLAVLYGLARRRHDGRPLLSGAGALPRALRLGLFGV